MLMVTYVCLNVYGFLHLCPSLSAEPHPPQRRASRYLYRISSWGPSWRAELSWKLQINPAVLNCTLVFLNTAKPDTYHLLKWHRNGTGSSNSIFCPSAAPPLGTVHDCPSVCSGHAGLKYSKDSSPDAEQPEHLCPFTLGIEPDRRTW